MTPKERIQKLQELEGLSNLLVRVRDNNPELRSYCTGLLYRIWQMESGLGEGLTDAELESINQNPARFSTSFEDFRFEVVAVERDQVRMNVFGNYRFNVYRPEIV